MSDDIKKLSDFSCFDDSQQALLGLFRQLGIPHETYAHPPIFTVEEGDALGLHDHIPGQGGKSLLLTTKQGELWLVVACDDTRVDLKALSDALQTKRFSFAKPEIMLEVMGVTPGSATPFALMNDRQKRLRVVLDRKFLAHRQCTFHPLSNAYSTVVTVDDLQKFMKHLGYEPIVMDLTGSA